MNVSPASSQPRRTRFDRGVSVVEVIIVLAVLGLLGMLLAPWVLRARELVRERACRHNLSRLALALNAYHDSHQRYPVAAVWSTAAFDSLSLHRSRRVDLYTHANWSQGVLPYLDLQAVAARFRGDLPVADPMNQDARLLRLPRMSCPSDPYNRPDNPYELRHPGRDPLLFARGNYAINGGSHCFKDEAESTAFLNGDAARLVMNPETREFRYWGNGVAGINHSFARGDFVNGTATLVLLDELRAGVHPVDPRGVWSLGQIGGSITWAHGVNGDAYGPNNQEPRSDDLLYGDVLHQTVGKASLEDAGMPCVHYVDVNFQATARSAHHGGVNVAMVDGSTRFLSDAIDPGLWHVLHSRETPPRVFPGTLDHIIADSMRVADPSIDGRSSVGAEVASTEEIENAFGMKFRRIAAGEFQMGLPDRGNDHDVPAEAPSHRVRITRSYYLGIHEVTRREYQDVMGGLPAGEPDPSNRDHVPDDPVVNVTWDEAERFCQELSAMPDERSAGRHYRLPTEAEWEYACRAGDREPYRWDRQRDPADGSGDAAGILPALPLQAVGRYPPNGFGLHDMRGNAWEWCADWFDRDYYARSPIEDPRGPGRGYIKVIRGGSWTFVGEGCKLSYPMMPPWKASPFVGFRVVCEPVGSTTPSARTGADEP